MKTLGTRQRKLLERRFSLGAVRQKLLEKVGKAFGITLELARQLQQEEPAQVALSCPGIRLG
jgi:DNA-directed RNA polymerase sigma subunit (sigma70/sigma32)